MTATTKQRLRIEGLEATNYQCFANASLRFSDINVFIGPNNSGKTSLLRLISGLKLVESETPIGGYGDAFEPGSPLTWDTTRRGSSGAQVIFDLGTANPTKAGTTDRFPIVFSAASSGAGYVRKAHDGVDRFYAESESVVQALRRLETGQAFLPAERLTQTSDRHSELLGTVTLVEVAEAISRQLLHYGGRQSAADFASSLRPFLEHLEPVEPEWPRFDFVGGVGVERLRLGFSEDRWEKVVDLGAAVREILLLGYVLRQQHVSLVLIDEPENHLHPSLIRAYCDELIARAAEKRWQLFIATHSNHVLDALASAKPSVFATARAGEVTVRSLAGAERGRLFELFDALGVRPSSALQPHCLIWVEGPTDAIYLRRFLALAGDESGGPGLQEYVDFAFAYFGGANLSTHHAGADLSEGLVDMVGIHRASFVIADSDRSSATSAVGKPYLERFRIQYPDRVWVTAGREIENYLSPEIVEAYMNKHVRGASPLAAAIRSDDAWRYANVEKVIGEHKDPPAPEYQLPKTQLAAFAVAPDQMNATVLDRYGSDLRRLCGWLQAMVWASRAGRPAPGAPPEESAT